MFYYLISNIGPQNHVVSRVLKNWGLFFGGISNPDFLMQETDNLDIECEYRHMIRYSDHAIYIENINLYKESLYQKLKNLAWYKKYCLCNTSLLPFYETISQLDSSLIVVDYSVDTIKSEVFFDMVPDETYMYYNKLIEQAIDVFSTKQKPIHRVGYSLLKQKNETILKNLKDFVNSEKSTIDFDIIDFENEVCKNLLISMFNEEK